SDTLAQLTAEGERLFYRLITQADDYGRFDARPSVVRSRCFQLGGVSDDKVTVWLHQLQAQRVVCLYEVEGRDYGHFPTWEKYQRIRAPRSRYPDPPHDAASCGELPRVAASCGPRAHAGASGSGVGVGDGDGVVVRKLRRRADKAGLLPEDFPFTDERRKFAEAGALPHPPPPFPPSQHPHPPTPPTPPT